MCRWGSRSAADWQSVVGSRIVTSGALAGAHAVDHSTPLGAPRSFVRRAWRSCLQGDLERTSEARDWSPVWQPWACVPHDRHAIAPYGPCTPCHRCAWPRCASARARSSKQRARVAARWPEHLRHGRVPEQSAHARQRIDIGLWAAARTVRDVMVACHRIVGTIVCRPPWRHRQRQQRPRW